MTEHLFDFFCYISNLVKKLLQVKFMNPLQNRRVALLFKIIHLCLNNAWRIFKFRQYLKAYN